MRILSKALGMPKTSERSLNGPQTTGRTYRNLSQPTFEIDGSLRNQRVPVHGGVELLADVYLPRGGPRAPAIFSASPYPRQIQDSGAPLGFVEAGATDFFVTRGYAHVIINVRGTGGRAAHMTSSALTSAPIWANWSNGLPPRGGATAVSAEWGLAHSR